MSGHIAAVVSASLGRRPLAPETTRRIDARLPIFEVTDGSSVVLYTPGHVAPSSQAEARAVESVLAGGDAPSRYIGDLASALRRHALRAEGDWGRLAGSRYEPECLTIYLSNHCNLGCVYCYAAGPNGERNLGWDSGSLPRLDPEAIRVGAQMVARNCRAKSKPFQLVIHGGGEPTLHWNLLQQVVATAAVAADAYGVPLQSYISTSGVVSEQQARWLARNLSHVSLSVDGPADVQNAQRPLRNGRPTSASVERTARILREEGARVSVRCTITRGTVHRQAEVLVDLVQRLGVNELSFEPAYRSRPEAGWGLHSAADAERYADHFLAAQYLADSLGCELDTSGVRLDEIHGPFCNTLRQVLQLTPDGAAVPCFVCTDGTQSSFASLRLGQVDARTGEGLRIDQERVTRLRDRAATIPAPCHSCHNVYHCARGCPDSCPIAEAPTAGGFRCRTQEKLGRRWILDSVSAPPPKGPPPEASELAAAVSAVAAAPADIATAPIMRSWLLARARGISAQRRAPDPIWAQRGFDLSGIEAWHAVQQIAAGRDTSVPLSIYVHVPYCDRACHFCDCHRASVASPTEEIVRRYVAVLRADIARWGAVGPIAARPVTTVHFGGGTPTFLAATDLAAIVSDLRRWFRTGPETEWAIETTTSQLTRTCFETLTSLGFTRLHVGVQSLDDEVRARAGRREAAGLVLDKLRRALDLGQIVTADVIYGLPGQSIPSLLETVSSLDGAGLHGMSLYRLNLSSLNRRFAIENEIDMRDRTESFFSLHMLEALLRARGYAKTHYAHFSKPEDRYLYYTHVRRGEDLLALGPSADGSFGQLHYKHHELSRYLGDRTTDAPSLLGAAHEDAVDRRLHGATSELMTASIAGDVLRSLSADGLLDEWLDQGLLAPAREPGRYELTASGSWFLTGMLAELRERTTSCPS